MPELPEVETIRRGLEQRIVGKKIVDLDIRYAKNFIGSKDDVLGQRVADVSRRAKVVAIGLSNDKFLLFHLKMTGQLIYRSELRVESLESKKNTLNSKPSTLNEFAGGHPDHNWHAKLPNSTTAIVFDFGDDSKLYFNDLRKFGWCKVLSREQLDKIFADDYGPEPIRLAGARSWQASEEFTPEYLIAKAKKIPNRKIKQFLTEQKIVAGIGNIYVDELLFDARISPSRKVAEITADEWKQVVKSTTKVLKLAIEQGGTTDSDYVNADGEKGGMQDYLKVYRKTGLPCPLGCGGKIERITLGGRGTHYCVNCQK